MSAASSAPVRASPWQQRRSLRVRLTVLLAGLLLLACAAAGVATTLALRTYLVHRFEQQLAAAGARYARALERSGPDSDRAATVTVGQELGTLGARIDRGVITSAGVIAPVSHPVRVGPADRAVLARLRPTGSSTVVRLPTLGEYRVLVTTDDDGALLAVGLPAHTLEETLRHTILAEALAFGVVLVSMSVLGAFGIQRSLRPLERVAATALRVSELPLGSGEVQLGDRVPEGDPQTEVGQVAVAINHMLERVEDALRQRQRSEDRLRQFVADASHELRTPLAVVRSHSELLQRIHTDLPDEVRRSLRRIDAETGRMSSLVDDLLLLARLDSGQPLEHEPVDLSLLAMDAVTDARVAGPDHRWRLDLPEEAVVLRGDQHRLHQVIANLLSNARIHTPAGTTVTVRIETPNEAEVLLAVHDTGPGIPPELLPTVADRFVRGDGARTHRIASSGLGLAIVAGVVAASGGRLDIASRPGGTTVSVLLPAAGRPPVPEPIH